MVLKWLGSREGMRRVMTSTSLCHHICLQMFLRSTRPAWCSNSPPAVADHAALLTTDTDYVREQEWVTVPPPLLYPVEWKWNHPTCTPSGKISRRVFDPYNLSHSTPPYYEEQDPPGRPREVRIATLSSSCLRWAVGSGLCSELSRRMLVSSMLSAHVCKNGEWRTAPSSPFIEFE